MVFGFLKKKNEVIQGSGPFRGGETIETGLEPVIPKNQNPEQILQSMEELIVNSLPALEKKYEEVMRYVLPSSPLSCVGSEKELAKYELKTIHSRIERDPKGTENITTTWAQKIEWIPYVTAFNYLDNPDEKTLKYFIMKTKTGSYKEGAPRKLKEELQDLIVEKSTIFRYREDFHLFVGMVGLYVEGKQLKSPYTADFRVLSLEKRKRTFIGTALIPKV